MNRLQRRGSWGAALPIGALSIFEQLPGVNIGDWDPLHQLILGCAMILAMPAWFIAEKKHDRDITAAEVFANAQDVVGDSDEPDDEDEPKLSSDAAATLKQDLASVAQALVKISNNIT